jgi:hypothetical protein
MTRRDPRKQPKCRRKLCIPKLFYFLKKHVFFKKRLHKNYKNINIVSATTFFQDFAHCKSRINTAQHP